MSAGPANASDQSGSSSSSTPALLEEVLGALLEAAGVHQALFEIRSVDQRGTIE